MAALYLGRAYVDRVHARAYGQYASIAVVQRTTRGAHRRLAHLLRYRCRLVLVVMDDLDVIKLRRKHYKRGYAAHR